jgi:acetolactate synthase-1/2/3 large subunit
VVSLPEDMLTERVAVDDAPAFALIETSPGPAEMAKLSELVAAARNPMMILGGSRWSQAACDAIARFAQKLALPVCTTFRRLHLFDALHPATPAISASVPIQNSSSGIKAADLVILVGGRMGELPSQSYTLFDIPRPQMTFVHVHPGAEELGRVYSPHLAIPSRRRPRSPRRSTASMSRRRRGPSCGRSCRLPRLDGEAHGPARARSTSAP